MLTIWKFDGLQSRHLGKRSRMVKVAGQSSAGRSHQWLRVPASFRNRDRQLGMNWCAGTWCYLKNQLRAVGGDNAGGCFITCCFGKWCVPHDAQGGTLHLRGRGSSLGDESMAAYGTAECSCLCLTLLPPAAVFSSSSLQHRPHAGRDPACLWGPVSQIGRALAVQTLLAGVPGSPFSSPSPPVTGPDASAVHPWEGAINQQLQEGRHHTTSAGLGNKLP